MQSNASAQAIHTDSAGGGPLSGYRAVVRLCEEMLQAAREENWGQVELLKIRRRELIDAVRNSNAAERMNQEERREKMQLLQRIVLIDGEMRRLTEPWQRNLEAMLSPRPAAGGFRPACS